MVRCLLALIFYSVHGLGVLDRFLGTNLVPALTRAICKGVCACAAFYFQAHLLKKYLLLFIWLCVSPLLSERLQRLRLNVFEEFLSMYSTQWLMHHPSFDAAKVNHVTVYQAFKKM